MPTPQEILERLKRVPYPGFSRDIVSFGIIKDVEVSSSGVTIHLAPTTAQPEMLRQIEDAGRVAVAAMPGVPGPTEAGPTAAPPPLPRGPQPSPRAATIPPI